jgi:hypothetical protein
MKVFDALGLRFEDYASDPAARFQARDETNRVLRHVLGYRLYRDLLRGWRITAPNLEQVGLLVIDYPYLRQVCEAADIWQSAHPSLANASVEQRIEVSRVLLDLMRRSLAIKVEYLDQQFQERLLLQSSQRLIPLGASTKMIRLATWSTRRSFTHVPTAVDRITVATSSSHREAVSASTYVARVRSKLAH